MRMNECTKSDEETVVEWNDAQIRWTNDSSIRPSPDDDDDDDEAPPDVFAPDPHQSFTLFQEIQLQGYSYESDQTWNSTGLTLWRASEYLGQYLLEQQEQKQCLILRNKRVLELGAGLGLCGILAHRLLHAQTVYVTDGDSDVLKALVSNIQVNMNQVTEQEQRTHTTISGHQLLWGNEYVQPFLNKMSRMEQQDDSSLLLFDIILAADVVYVPQVIAPLFETVQALLQPTTGGIFLLAFARRMVDVTVDDVLQQATQAGFVYEKCSSDADTEQGLYLYSFSRRRNDSDA